MDTAVLECFNIYLYITYFIWYTVRPTHVPPKATRRTKLQDTQCSPGLSFRSTDFHVPENLIFPALSDDTFLSIYHFVAEVTFISEFQIILSI